MITNPNMTRCSLFAVVGGYLIYLAYDMGKDLADNVPTTMPRWLLIIFIVLFAVIGVTLLVFTWKLWQKGRLDQDQNPVDLEQQEQGATSEKETPDK